ncbi:hypothetical protein CROQUDRAFT_95152 [Cronartium quercuum f. sp. fusiforme G11]|uniref:mannan endo-1,4-beta-mannosidase n=1 Tax=Cronartium quercuum f. sp. fusiforme G11 TaxID=708437 RepID=A0A9P6NDZ5_9BASI|nr:hypothetical protein CROQUDRAFT_95152 [Cronartium quercuum f. sp. fusiforme G11]
MTYFCNNLLFILGFLPLRLVLTRIISVLPPSHPQLQFVPQASMVPAFPDNALTGYTPKPKKGFVNTKNKHFYLDGNLFDFRSFNSPSLVPQPTVYEVLDVVRSIAGFAAPVTRSYTLRIANEQFGQTSPVQSIESSHITGWNSSKNDWDFNELAWKRLDKMLAVAAEEGVKIIFPIINQDYGSASTNWAGNFNDLIRHRYNISDYSRAQITVDWFVDKSIREDFKKILHFMLTRKNTVNGRVYGEDDTFLAFETGNEMNWASINFKSPVNITNSSRLISSPTLTNVNTSFTLTHTRPAPANWTIEIAQYIKSLAPNILVMDGSYARNKNVTEAWPVESLQSPYIDVFSYHYYGDEDLSYVTECQARVESFGKTFVVGEHGFYLSTQSLMKGYKFSFFKDSNSSNYQYFYDTFKGAGALIWSLRGHDETSGFQTHSEGNNIFSLHVPGFKNQTSKEFDQLEYDIFPIPGPPYPFFATNSTATGISFKGSAWAEHYEIWGATNGGRFVKVADNVYDNVGPGELFIAIEPSKPEEPLYVPPFNYINTILPQTGWADNKWFEGLVRVILRPPGFRKRHRSLSHSSRRHSTISPLSHQVVKRSGGPGTNGGWFCVRGVSVNGVPGVFSHPAYISASDDV